MKKSDECGKGSAQSGHACTVATSITMSRPRRAGAGYIDQALDGRGAGYINAAIRTHPTAVFCSAIRGAVVRSDCPASASELLGPSRCGAVLVRSFCDTMPIASSRSKRIRGGVHDVSGALMRNPFARVRSLPSSLWIARIKESDIRRFWGNVSLPSFQTTIGIPRQTSRPRYHRPLTPVPSPARGEGS